MLIQQSQPPVTVAPSSAVPSVTHMRARRLSAATSAGVSVHHWEAVWEAA
jgi:hypothetical protein